MAEKLKGVNALESIMTDLLEDFGISKVELGTEYAYYWADEHITFQITYSQVDKWFDEFITKRFHIDNYDSFIFSLLHEVGHHMTMDNIPEDIQDLVDKRKEELEDLLSNENLPLEEQKKLEFEYFNLYDEIRATRWAVRWYKKHNHKAKKMGKTANLALQAFYRINNVTQ